MSASITRSIVAKQLVAMGCQRFDVGILHRNGRMLLREGWKTERVDAAISWFRRENARGAHIFVRPHGAHALSLVDDVSADAIAAMKESGFQPAVVVETSPDNFQVYGSTTDECSPIARLAAEPPRNWSIASEAILPAPIGATLVGLRVSRTRSRTDASGMVSNRSYDCMNARAAPTSQRANF